MSKLKLSILTIHMDTGGAERVISLLLKPLVSQYDVTLVLIANTIHFDIPEQVKVVSFFPAERINNNGLFGKLGMMYKSMINYRRFVKQEGIDISVSFLALPNFINSYVAMRNKDITTVISERCFPSRMYALKRSSLILAKWFYPFFYNKNSVLFSNSLHINNDLKVNFGIRIPMEVIYNPIDNSNIIHKKDASQIHDPIQLVNVGSFTAPKNQAHIVRSMKLLEEPVNLTLIGEGSLRIKIEGVITELELTEYVQFTGRISNVFERLSQCDCFVLSSITEGFPNVLLEAMAVGLPVIATNCESGPLEILNENIAVNITKGEYYCAKFGLLIEVEDDEALAKAIDHLRSHPGEYRKYSELSLARAKDYSLPKIYEEFQSMLSKYH